MATSNEEQNETIQESTPIIAANKASKCTRGPSMVLIGLAATVALIGSVYAIYENFQLNQLSTLRTQQVSAVIADLQTEELRARAKLDGTVQSMSLAQLALQSQLNTMNKNLQASLQERLYQKQDWLLLKARYYLELAQINTHWSDNPQTTVALLQQADSLLAPLMDKQLFPIRQALAKEISQLEALPHIDLTGILSQLDAAQTATIALPIKPIISINNSTTEDTKNDKNSSYWRTKFDESLHYLGKLIVIRRNDEAIQPLLSPLAQSMLRDSLRLNIQQAQWAVLQKNQSVYQIALAQALKTLNQGFDTQAPDTQALIKQLQLLEQEKITSSQPPIQESLDLLNQWIENKTVTTPVDNTKGVQQP